ncbi:MAG: hypothetical protein KBI32_08575 [Phycisphaerae bacterium]|nr:hypothetical protein [Phycisphaerae bacterium]HON91046.1 hypothetical protein [Sedimentisphaerales bacterium]
MNERKDERWLDEQLERAVNGSAPVFDAQSWRKTHAGEYEILLARQDRPDGCGVRSVWVRRTAWLAIAAVVVMGVTLLFVDGPGPFRRTPITQLCCTTKRSYRWPN